MEIRKNYENYERVQKTFKEFIHALVWESAELENGASEQEINDHINKYCNTHGDQMIALTNDSVSKYITALYARYKVTYYECEGYRVKKIGQVINTDNMEVALAKAAEFYRNGTRPYIEVFDNETKKYIAKWE
jgi:hypothetical protein